MKGGMPDGQLPADPSTEATCVGRNGLGKPSGLCVPVPDDPEAALGRESEAWRRMLGARGLRSQTGTPSDLEALMRWQAWTWLSPESWEPAYVLDSVLRYGQVSLVTDHGTIVAAAMSWLHADRDQTCQALRYGVDPRARGWGLGRGLLREHALECSSLDALIRRGTVQPGNLVSLTHLVNGLGCIADGWVGGLYDGSPLFSVAVPLTPAGLFAGRVDPDHASEWVRTHSPHDYRILHHTDTPRLEALYAETEYRVVAVLPGGALLCTIPGGVRD